MVQDKTEQQIQATGSKKVCLVCGQELVEMTLAQIAELMGSEFIGPHERPRSEVRQFCPVCRIRY